jgi:hypothetical protein
VAAVTEIALSLDDLPAFRAEITVPMLRCPQCGLAQARSGKELQQLVPSALVHAFHSAAIKAPG